MRKRLRRLLSLDLALFVWNIGWFLTNVRWWLDNPPLGWLAVAFFGLVILAMAYRFGYEVAGRRAMRQIIAQQHKLDAIKAELDHTVMLQMVSTDPTRPGEVDVRTYVCLN